MVVKPLYNQSNYDVCLQVYGSLDNLIKFSKENDINDLNVSENKQYYFDENSIIDKNVTGTSYSTNVLQNQYYDYNDQYGNLYQSL